VRFVSTRGEAPAVSFSEAALNGLAPDGGLYVPTEFPRFEPGDLDVNASFPVLAARILGPFLAGDRLESKLEEICERAFDFPMPLVPLARETALLELFHGPTAAFKDFGARFLAACFGTLRDEEEGAPLTVLVATSGDTGAAVASAFHHQAGTRVGVLFPQGGVAPRQEKQLTCWDDNVHSFAVRGTFDDCQRVVKQAFRRAGWPASGGLSSANSINIGRLLPQAVYYGVASSRYLHENGELAGFVVPSGNVGNSIGAFWALQMGFPVREIAMAANANRAVPDWFETGRWEPRASRPTLANAMDVGDPSNMERLFHLYPDRESLLAVAQALSVDDETIRKVIADGPQKWGRVFCPHTATAIHLRDQLASPHCVVVATAHPAKFDGIVEPLIGRSVDVPPRLADLLARPSSVTVIEPDLDGLVAELDREV
jgi:threonine synthase